ncbi:MAG: hypothetical protein GEV28_29850 [Actinophytocola sp.]|uniref:hypothetical protein n=1 Tax=Actinophytocola sp. TaxID=1872138 RepID=UPI00132AC3B3|nr:hypothetical protein [Actinophytocola sp.]MPZ84370.1 hypothetical protein [Actinophytocola sp.]
MAHKEQPDQRSGGVSRRKVILTGAGLAAAGVVVGAAVPLVTQSVADGSAEVETPKGIPTEPVMVHLRDAATGHFDVFVGTRRVQVTDRAFAARLAKAATA